MLILQSCNFSDSTTEESGGGLFVDHRPSENTLTLLEQTSKTLLLGNKIQLKLQHPAALTVTGTPRIPLDIGGVTKYANYISGSGSRTLTFEYTISSGDEDNNGISYATNLDLNGGTIVFVVAGVNTNSTTSITDNTNFTINVDTTAPQVTSTVSAIPKTYYLNEQIIISLVFDDIVNITGTPQIDFDLNGVTKKFSYLNGSGTSSIAFAYTVTSTDLDTNGLVSTGTVSLNSGSLKDQSGIDANLTFTAPDLSSVNANGEAPIVEEIIMPSNQTYYVNDTLTYQLRFNEVVNVTNTPQLIVDIGSEMTAVDYISGSGTDTLTFAYQIEAGKEDANGVTLQGLINLNGGTIQDVAANDAKIIILPPLTPLVIVDGSVPQITQINIPSPNTYVADDFLDFEVIFNRPVEITNSPRISLNIGGETRYADYLIGSNTTNITFRHQVNNVDNDPDGIEITPKTIDLNSTGIIRDPTTLANADVDFTSLTIDPSTILVSNTQIATQLAFNTQPITTTAGQNNPASITVEVQDSLGNIVTSSTDSITLTFGNDPSSGSAALGGTLTKAAVNGIATFNDINIDIANIGYSLSANSGSLTGATSNSFDIIAASAAQLSFKTQPSDTSYSVNINPSIEVEIQDSFGNIVSSATDNITLAFGSDPSSGSANLAGTLTVAAVNGIATFNDINIDTLNTGYTLIATSGSLTNATSNTFNILAGAASQLFISNQPSDVIESQVISPNITIEIHDAAGNLVTNSSDNITLALGTDPSSGSATLGGTFSLAAVNGVATFNDITIDTPQNGYTLSATSGLLTGSITNSFNVLPAAPTQLAFVTQPSNATSLSTISPDITVELRDALGNLVNTATDNVTLSFGTDPSSGAATLGGTLTVAAINGMATFSDINIDLANTGYTLVASSGSLTNATSSTFDITSGAAAQLAFTTQPVHTSYSENITPSITVEIQDAQGNTITSSSDSVTLSLGTDPSSGTATLGGTLTVNAINGIATFNDINIDTLNSGYTLNANSGSLTNAISNSFDILAGPATQLVITNQPSDSIENQNISPAITIEIQDSAGNLVSNATDNVTLNFGTDPSSGSATLGGTPTVAAVNGVATFNDINIDTANTGYTLSFNSGSLSSAISNSFDINPSGPAQLAFKTQPSNAVSNTNIAPSIEIEVQDALGNIVNTATDNITLALSSDPSSGAANLAGTLTVAAVNGVATFNDINIDLANTGYSLVATSGSLTNATSNNFDITAGAASKLAFSVQPINTSYSENITPSIQVEIQDSAGNLVTNSSDSVNLAFGADPSSGSATLGGTLTIAAVNGIATFSDINIDTLNSGYTLIASSGSLSNITSNTFDITAGAPTQLVINTQPTNTIANQNISPAITIEIQDAAGNIVTNSSDNVSLALGTDPSSGTATLGGTLTIAAVSGIATFNDINIDTVNTGYTFVFTSGALSSATSNTFDIAPNGPTQLAFKTQPSDSVSGSNISPNIEVEIQDSLGNIVTSSTENITLSFDTDPSSGSANLAGTLTVQAINGVATFNDINIDLANTGYTLAANSGSLTSAISNAFNITPGSATQLSFKTQPIDTSFSVNITPNIEVQIQDTAGNLVTTASNNITLSLGNDPSSGAANLDGTLTVAATSGVATFNDINIDTVNTGYTLIASSGVLTNSTSNAFNILAGPATQLVITTQPENKVVNETLNSITVELRDATNNIVTIENSSVTVNFGTDPSGSATISGTKTVSASSGIATFSDLSINNISNGYTLTFSSGSLTSATSTSFDIQQIPTLAFSPTTTYDYGNVSLGDSNDATFLINHTGGTATSVSETSLSAPFAFKGGSFPGTGGTCSSSISGTCTIVVSYTPSATSNDNGTITMNYNNGSGLTNITKSISGTGISNTPTALNVIGPNAVITNNCVPYAIKSTDNDGNNANVSSNETVTLVINNGTGNFYSDANCTTTTSTATISSNTSSTDVYFKSSTPSQNLTLIFNAATLTNTSRAVSTSNEPIAIFNSAPPEIVTGTCTQIEVSLLDGNGVKTGASTTQTVDIVKSGNEKTYNDSFCTGEITQLSFAQYEGTKYIFVKNTTAESSTLTFNDSASTLTSANSTITFVSNLTWWDNNYAKRVRITFNNLDQATTFNNIPVLVKLDSSKINYSDFLAGSNDIRFTLDDHTTTLNYTIEKWNTSGTSFIWVKLPSISASSELDIYMYYGNSSASNSENSNSVFSSFNGVWNMNKSGASYLDSTSGANNGAANGTISDIVGPVGDAVYLDGSSTLQVTNDLNTVLGATSTLSFWIKTNQTGDATDWRAPGITGVSGTAASQDLFYGYIKDTGRIGSSSGGGTQVESNFVVNDNTWRYITVSRNATTGEFRYYINGVLNGNGTSGTGIKTVSFFDFGATTKKWGGGGFIYLQGSMDGIRITNSVLSDDRVRAEYKFLTTNNTQFGQVENK